MEKQSISYSYEQNFKKKRYFIEEKICSREKMRENYPHVVSFHPQVMNLLYGSPSERRDFLDTILIQAFPAYEKILKNYKTILLSRNKVLKNIAEKKSQLQELDFWNNKFLEIATDLYNYREKLILFLEENTPELKSYFF